MGISYIKLDIIIEAFCCESKLIHKHFFIYGNGIVKTNVNVKKNFLRFESQMNEYY